MGHYDKVSILRIAGITRMFCVEWVNTSILHAGSRPAYFCAQSGRAKPQVALASDDPQLSERWFSGRREMTGFVPRQSVSGRQNRRFGPSASLASGSKSSAGSDASCSSGAGTSRTELGRSRLGDSSSATVVSTYGRGARPDLRLSRSATACWQHKLWTLSKRRPPSSSTAPSPRGAPARSAQDVRRLSAESRRPLDRPTDAVVRRPRPDGWCSSFAQQRSGSRWRPFAAVNSPWLGSRGESMWSG